MRWVMDRLVSWLVLVVIVCVLPGCGCVPDPGDLLPNESGQEIDTSHDRLIARFAHVTDTHVMDVMSPARFPPADVVIGSSWRSQEAYSTQLLDGIIRAVNRRHQQGDIVDFLLVTGDLIDNNQRNEIDWFLTCMDGGPVEPRSGPDDRDPADRPSASMDPYHAFIACGLYQQGIHGEKPSIPWYAIMGNHEWYALGTLPIVEIFGARRIAPLPMPLLRLGISIPRWLDPEGDVAYGPITPANPGPPAILDFPCYVIPNPDRRYLSIPEMIESFRQTRTQPPGHGFPDTSPSRTWYSVSPLPGLRLIALDTSYRFDPLVGSICSEGFLIRAQLNFLKAELRKAEQKKEVVVVATHHPSHNLDQFGCPDVTGDELRAVLADSPAVVLHLCGHIHRNRVIRRAHYVEIETASIIDCPQEGRWIEIWRSDVDGSILLKYEMFSHLATVDAGSMELDALDDDPLAAMREYAYEMACEDGAAPIARKTARMVKGFDEILDVTPVGDLTGSSAGYCNDERQGMIRLPAQ